MAYCVLADVEIAAGGDVRLRKLADFDGQSSTVNVAVVDKAIAAADATINTYAHKRYGVDIAAPIPTAIVQISMAEAVFKLKEWRGMLTNDDIDLRAIRMQDLEDFSTGKNSLGVSPPPAASETIVAAQTDRPTDKAISREKLKGFW